VFTGARTCRVTTVDMTKFLLGAYLDPFRICAERKAVQ
jgi:hypothetical protein